MTLAVQEEVIQRADEARRLRQRPRGTCAIRSGVSATALSASVDPNNRLAASVLEAEWNAKLVALQEARAVEERYNQGDQQQVSVEERADIEQVSQRFRRFWNDPKTTARERKHAVRLVIEDVTAHKTDRIVAHIRPHREEPHRRSW